MIKLIYSIEGRKFYYIKHKKAHKKKERDLRKSRYYTFNALLHSVTNQDKNKLFDIAKKDSASSLRYTFLNQLIKKRL